MSLLHPYDLDANAKPLIRWPFDKLDDLEIEQRHYRSWINANKELFNAGVPEVLPPPLEAQRDEPFTDPMVERASNKHRAIQFINTIEKLSDT
ncbi:hypothetical protein [Leptolyngbya sp. 7M]|uniref:hypothetical protein n=1 Tax=Leptolyngbya sp. 7M TaxID=2812896 RepID=UPI001B8CC87B|nr:hypothetical protein [Leptolyngbya sp. 7M]QYO63607.1 hypothetical protein JVX88_27605 [Leptolyngbya sp. 7M]